MDTELKEPTTQNSIKIPKVVKPTNKPPDNKIFGTRALNSPMSLPSLIFATKN